MLIQLKTLLDAIKNAPESASTTLIELATLEDRGEDGNSAIMVDRIIKLEKLTPNFPDLKVEVVLLYEVGIEADLNNKLSCTGVDANTENTWVRIKANCKNFMLVVGGDNYNTDELGELSEFHNAILNSEMNDLTEDTATKILKQF